MRDIAFEELSGADYNLSDIIFICQRWRSFQQYADYERKHRPNHGIMMLLSCCAEYSNGLSAQAGDVIYLPEGINYGVRFLNRKPESRYSNFLINFKIYDIGGEPVALAREPLIIRPRDSSLSRRLFSEMGEAARNIYYPPALIRAALYRLLTELSFDISAVPVGNGGLLSESPISPAVKYLAENCLRSGVQVGRLAELCHMSEANFRRVFEKCEGCSPKAFINNARLSRAKTLLSAGISVSDTARSVGFEDVSYFIRFFGRHTGVSPGSFALQFAREFENRRDSEL